MMITMFGIGAYALLMWVLGTLIIRERRRARSLSRIRTGVLPYFMSVYR